jgi:hypothetical protein
MDLVQAAWSGDLIPVVGIFFVLLQTDSRPTRSPIQWVLGLFLGGKVAGVWRSSTHPYLEV